MRVFAFIAARELSDQVCLFLCYLVFRARIPSLFSPSPVYIFDCQSLTRKLWVSFGRVWACVPRIRISFHFAFMGVCIGAFLSVRVHYFRWVRSDAGGLERGDKCVLKATKVAKAPLPKCYNHLVSFSVRLLRSHPCRPSCLFRSRSLFASLPEQRACIFFINFGRARGFPGMEICLALNGAGRAFPIAFQILISGAFKFRPLFPSLMPSDNKFSLNGFHLPQWIRPCHIEHLAHFRNAITTSLIHLHNAQATLGCAYVMDSKCNNKYQRSRVRHTNVRKWIAWKFQPKHLNHGAQNIRATCYGKSVRPMQRKKCVAADAELIQCWFWCVSRTADFVDL